MLRARSNCRLISRLVSPPGVFAMNCRRRKARSRELDGRVSMVSQQQMFLAGDRLPHRPAAFKGAYVKFT